MGWSDDLRRALAGEEVAALVDVIEGLPDAMTLSEGVRGPGGEAVDMRLLFMNRKAREGQPDPDAAIGGLCSELWPGMVTNGSFHACMRVLDSGEPESGEFVWTDDATYRPAGYDWRAVRLGDDVLLWVLRDVSDRLRREQAVTEVYEKVVQSLTTATMALELGKPDMAANDLAGALAAAKTVTTRELPTLPMTVGADSPAQSIEPRAGGAVRTLLCDDEPDLRSMLRIALESSGRFAVVAEAGDGRAAIDQARTVQPELVVMDVNMPEMSGVEALPHIRRAAPGTTVVVLSGLLSGAAAEQALAAGAAAYIEKGTSIRVILDRLNGVLGLDEADASR